MHPKLINIEELRCNAFARGGHNFDMCKYTDFKRESATLSQTHRHNYYMIFLVLEGTGSQRIDFHSYSIQPQSIFLMYPGMVHEWEEDHGLEGYLIFFTDEFFTLRYNTNNLFEFPFFNNSYGDPYLHFTDSDEFLRMVQLFELTYEEYNIHENDSLKVLRSYLNIILVECKRRYETHHTPSKTDLHARRLVKEFEQMIDRHFERKHLVKEYAEMLKITPNYLNSICKRITGKSAGEHIRRRIMLEARRMLMHDDRTVSEISHALHFDDNSYFCRFFKKYEGISPDKFRRTYLQSN